VIDKSEDFGQNIIRQKVHSFWNNREIPTLNKLLVAGNKDDNFPTFSKSSLRRILKHLNYEYLQTNRNSALIERNDIVCWRRKYMELVTHHRFNGRPIYYLGESWIDTGETTTKSRVNTIINSPGDSFVQERTTGQKEPSGKGKRLIVLHIGSADGFIPGGLLCIESKKNILDNRDELNGDTFYNWFIKILPILKENAVIVIDNASYNSVKKKPFPTMTWNKQKIIDWLENNGEMIPTSLIKPQLLEIANKLKPLHDKYVIDEVARDHNKIVLRLPPNHSELNPIEFAWSWVKHHVLMNNTTFKLEDVHILLKDAVEQVTSEMWKNFIDHVVKEEDKFWTIDDLSDEIFDAEIGEDPGNTTSDSDDENI